jgi:hypothetical protein
VNGTAAAMGRTGALRDKSAAEAEPAKQTAAAVVARRNRRVIKSPLPQSQIEYGKGHIGIVPAGN